MKTGADHIENNESNEINETKNENSQINHDEGKENDKGGIQLDENEIKKREERLRRFGPIEPMKSESKYDKKNRRGRVRNENEMDVDYVLNPEDIKPKKDKLGTK
jgi:hypothetical protein